MRALPPCLSDTFLGSLKENRCHGEGKGQERKWTGEKESGGEKGAAEEEGGRNVRKVIERERMAGERGQEREGGKRER